MKNKTCKTNTNLEEAVKAIATRMSEQIGLVAASSLREMLFVLMEERENGYAQVSEDQNEFPTADKVAKILKISWALAYRKIQTRNPPLFRSAGP
ncbi:MAG: hypothetical protein C3F07_00125 [Anaerolineales bacterium]|nr:hypothetical protein [Anaerolineae bacterium]PWB78164.1 MAG: hypothetical protein C3F07_00125 [Anaerolineales bacterium]